MKQLVSGKKTRKDHPQVMNAAVRLYADAANAKTKMENGFDLTNYDERTLAFAKDYANQLLAIDVNLDTTEMEFMLAKLNLLEHARKKTTQKVNLFEKVQIPGYQDLCER